MKMGFRPRHDYSLQRREAWQGEGGGEGEGQGEGEGEGEWEGDGGKQTEGETHRQKRERCVHIPTVQFLHEPPQKQPPAQSTARPFTSAVVLSKYTVRAGRPSLSLSLAGRG